MRKRISLKTDQGEVNLTPLLDIVFIMLIFFVATSTFAKEEGIAVSRLAGGICECAPDPPSPIKVSVEGSCQVHVEGRIVTREKIHLAIEQFEARRRGIPAVLYVDNDTTTECAVHVMEKIREGGVFEVLLRKQRPAIVSVTPL